MEPKGTMNYDDDRNRSFVTKRIAKDHAERLLNFVNMYDSDYDSFAKTIAGEHKTLQQSIMRLFITTIREMAKVTPDDRNAQTVELANKIVEIADGYSLPLI